jgi:hydroxypyruvate isomerase
MVDGRRPRSPAAERSRSTSTPTTLGHYHTAGNPGRHDLDEGQELYYPAIMRAILATGYDGYVSHEFIPRGDPVAALKAAFDQCNVTP